MNQDYNAGVFGGKTDLSAINLNLSGSYRVSQGLTAGAGLNAVYAKAEVERRAGILSDAVKKCCFISSCISESWTNFTKLRPLLSKITRCE